MTEIKNKEDLEFEKYMISSERKEFEKLISESKQLINEVKQSIDRSKKEKLIKKISLPYSEYLIRKIDKEGFDYAFEGYSDFIEVEDEHFHKLRKEYLRAREKLEKYIKRED